MNEVFFLLFMLLSISIAALLVVKINNVSVKIDIPEGYRFGAIDGLRGYLSIFVFFHHYYIFYYWRTMGVWVHPSVNYINNLGLVSVCIFFMITGFLFVNKISSPAVNWRKLYLSRFFRIVPLYFFVIVVTVFYSFIITGFELNVSFNTLMKEAFKWFLFIGDEINGYADSRRVTAGVTWTLKYEWLFYFSLPFLFFVIKNRFAVIIVSLGCIIFTVVNIHILSLFEGRFFIFFLYGAVASYFYKNAKDKFKLFFTSQKCSMVSMLCILYLLFSGREIFSVDMSLVSFVFFVFIVFGNNLFGVLDHRSSKILGEISYSIYLLHGIVIFTIFFFIIDPKNINDNIYLLLMPFVTILVITCSLFSFRYIEMFFISFGKKKIIKLFG